MKKRYAVAFTGPSNSGKTTTIEKVARILMEDAKKVAIIKNDPKDKAVFDVEGKDSWKFFRTGAEVVVTSPSRTTLFSHRQKSLEEIVEMLGDFDYLLVEGLKTLPLPRIAIFRNSVDESYFYYSEAIAVDDSVEIDEYDIPPSIDLLDLNDTDRLVDWIKTHAKAV
ncbi:molybdopterin-guanine dinucleotide biosynthesis protein B [Hydrogenimonas sp.]